MIDKLMDKFPFADANVKVELNLDGKAYDVEQFKIGFSQPVDHKGKPQSETVGGQMMVTLLQTVPESFYSWNIQNKFKNGSVVFKTERSGIAIRIEFIDAKCVSLHRTIAIGKGVESTIVISPSKVLLNGMEHDNFWIND